MVEAAKAVEVRRSMFSLLLPPLSTNRRRTGNFRGPRSRSGRRGVSSGISEQIVGVVSSMVPLTFSESSSLLDPVVGSSLPNF